MSDIAKMGDTRGKSHARRRSLIFCASLVFGMVVAAPSALAQVGSRNIAAAEWAKIQDAARKEGKVVVYATMGPAVHDRIVEAFNAANPGIKMELVRIVGAALTTKIEQERLAQNVAGADMMLTADVRWAGDAVKKGYLKTPVGPAAAAYPDSWMRGGQVALVAPTPWVIHYNTNLVKTPITGYQDLLRPEFTGKIGGVSLVAEVVTLFYKWLDESNPGYLEKLSAQKVKMYPSTVGSANSTASGEISVGVFSVIPVDNALHAQKAPMKTVIPNPSYGFAYTNAPQTITGPSSLSILFYDGLGLGGVTLNTSGGVGRIDPLTLPVGVWELELVIRHSNSSATPTIVTVSNPGTSGTYGTAAVATIPANGNVTTTSKWVMVNVGGSPHFSVSHVPAVTTASVLSAFLTVRAVP